MAVQALAFPGQFQGLLRVIGGQQIHHQARIPQPSDGVDPGGELEANGTGIDRRIVETGHLLQGLEPRQRTVLEPWQAVHQPAAIDPLQRSHVGDGADAEEVQGHGQSLG